MSTTAFRSDAVVAIGAGLRRPHNVTHTRRAGRIGNGMTLPVPHLRNPIEDRLGAGGVDVHGTLSIARYLAGFDALPEIAPYHRLPEGAPALHAEIVARAGPAALEDYLRLAMLHLIARGHRDHGADLEALHAAHIARILGDIAHPRRH